MNKKQIINEILRLQKIMRWNKRKLNEFSISSLDSILELQLEYQIYLENKKEQK